MLPGRRGGVLHTDDTMFPRPDIAPIPRLLIVCAIQRQRERVMNHEHNCGAELLVCRERMDLGGAGEPVYRTAFRSTDFAEIHHCPGCGAELYPELQAGQLRCLALDDAA